MSAFFILVSYILVQASSSLKSFSFSSKIPPSSLSLNLMTFLCTMQNFIALVKYDICSIFSSAQESSLSLPHRKLNSKWHNRVSVNYEQTQQKYSLNKESFVQGLKQIQYIVRLFLQRDCKLSAAFKNLPVTPHSQRCHLPALCQNLTAVVTCSVAYILWIQLQMCS